MTAPAKAAPMRDDVTREPYNPIDDAITKAFIDGWNSRLDHTDFDRAMHYWMLRSVTHIGTARPDAGDEDVERVAIPREPTEAMMDAGLYQSSHDSGWADVNQTWKAMFDAATLDGGSSTDAPAAMREGVDRGMVERRDRYLAGLFDTIFERFCEGDWEIEVNDLITDGALAAGLVECITFDPDEHIDVNEACEPGDDFYQITAAGREVIARARQKPAALSPEQPR